MATKRAVAQYELIADRTVITRKIAEIVIVRLVVG